MAPASICSGFCGRVLDVPEMTAEHSCGETPPQLGFCGVLAASNTAESGVLGGDQDDKTIA